MNKLLLISAIILSLISCSKSIKVNDFNSALWKAAKNNCDSSRVSQLTVLKQHQSEFIAVSEGNIKELFGRPDKQEILSRMGRRYHYYLTPSKKCNPSLTEDVPSLIIEFEHMGKVKLIIIPKAEAIIN